MFIQDLSFNYLCCFCFFLDFVRKCGLDVVVSMTQIKCGFTLMLMKSNPVRQLCFWVPGVPETKMCGNVFLIEILSGTAPITEWICNAKHFSWHVCLWKWKVTKLYARPFSCSFPNPIRFSLSLSLSVYVRPFYSCRSSLLSV